MKVKERLKPKAPLVEPGVYIAVCVGVIDLGEQYSEKFKDYQNKVKFVWELIGETVEIDGETKPRQLSKDFQFATGKANAPSNLREWLGSWNGVTYSIEDFKELEMFDQIGKACQIQVALSKTGEYSNVENIMALPKGMSVPKALSEPITWDMKKWDDVVFEKLSEWTRKQIMKSTQYQKEHTPEETITVDTSEEECPI
ncbi:MAG: hypothetical protein J6K63_00055 [Clostridia bacterium]|nr:hypothetical protein [Clostridia bacterium]